MRRSTRRLLSATVLVLAVLGALLAGAVVTGWVTFGGTHGVSMNPVYYQGDLVLVARADSYRVGDIVAYRVPAQHMIILHRIIGEADGGFVMNGDNNESIDPTHPHPQPGDRPGDAIRHRYAALLVAVHPMPTPAGRPVIDVTAMATLAKLAERYGVLILHWTRSDVETFIVQDDGTTYRHRTGASTCVAAPEPAGTRTDA